MITRLRRFINQFRDVKSLKFKHFLELVEIKDFELAQSLRDDVIALFTDYYKTMGVDEIENMKWRDVQHRMAHIGKRMEQLLGELRDQSDMMEVQRILGEAGWEGAAVNSEWKGKWRKEETTAST